MCIRDRIYTIDLSPSADQFPELFEYGMNHFFAHLDERIRSIIRAGDAKLILSCLNEKCDGYEKHNILTNIKIQDPGIGRWTELWTPWSVPKSKVDTIHLKDVPMYETLMCEEFDEQPLKIKRNKKFISLCRRYQPERIATFMFLVAHNLIDQGYVSMPSKSVHAPFVTLYSEAATGHLMDSDVALLDFPFVKKALENDSVKNNQDHVLDIEPLTEQQRAIYNPENQGFGFNAKQQSLAQYYNDSYLSLIQEGDGYDQRHSFMITEKTIRAMMLNHMFVMIGPPRLLMSLHEKGYKTFEDIWDESYDLIEDDKERLVKSLNICKELIEGDIESLYKQAEPIIKHNRDRIFQRIEEFRETLC